MTPTLIASMAARSLSPSGTSSAWYMSASPNRSAQVDTAPRATDAAGQGKPKGRSHHSTFGPEDRLMVYDVWDSQEDFDAFGQALMPILAELGVDPDQPDVMPGHNIVQ